jgi:hypothetical protein
MLNPCSPLGWTLVWEQAMVRGWRDAALRSLADHGPPDIADQRERADAARRFRTDLTYLNAAELVDRARGLLPLLQATFAGAVAAGTRTAADADEDGPDAMERALWALSRLVAGSDDLKLYFDGGIPGILERLDASPSSEAKVFLDAFDTFLYDHGCRGPGQWDIAGDVWETRPDLALTRLDRLRAIPDDPDPGPSPAPGRAEAGPATVGALKVINEIRITIRELGRQVAASDHIADAALVMMLTADELDDFVTNPQTYGLKLSGRARRHAHS